MRLQLDCYQRLVAEALLNQPPWQPQLQGAQRAAAQANNLLFEACTDALLRRWGNHPQALLDLAAVLLQAGALSRCEALLHWCHQLEPHSQKPLLNLANLWLQTLRQAQALELYAQLEPSSNLLMALGYQEQQPAVATRQWAERWAQLQCSPRSPTSGLAQSPPSGLLRLGFLSADFCQHPVGLFLLPLAEQLAAQPQIQLCFYDNSPRTDWLTECLQACGSWHRTQGHSDAQVADQIRADQLSVLIDLGGHTARSRLPVLLQRPAPVQLSWLGYWATTGLAGVVDGVLADPLVVPPASPEERSFSEPVLRFPQCRWCFRPVPWMPAVVDPPCVESGWVTFGSFNSSAKLNHRLLRCWAGVLMAVPDSRLLLRNYQLQDFGLQQQIRQAFIDLGVNPRRLELQGPCFHAELLAAYSQVDIALDPFPFNGGLTSCEALWLGLPLVTLAGTDQAAVMAARQGLALLQQIGRPEWIATSEAHYIAIAAKLAADPLALQEIRRQQRARMQASSLCDASGFAAAFLKVVWSAVLA